MTQNRKLISEEEAQRILGVSKSTLRKRLSKLGLQHLTMAGKRLYYTEQVNDLARARKLDTKLRLSNQEWKDGIEEKLAFLLRNQRIMALSSKFAFLYREFSDDDLRGLYLAATQNLGKFVNHRPPRQFIRQWVSVVPLLTRREFLRLPALIDTGDEPWLPFFQLSEELLRAAYTNYDLTVDAGVHDHRALLAICVYNLQQIAFEHYTVKSKSPRQAAAEALAVPYMTDEMAREQYYAYMREGLDEPGEAISSLIDYTRSEVSRK